MNQESEKVLRRDQSVNRLVRMITNNQSSSEVTNADVSKPTPLGLSQLRPLDDVSNITIKI